MNEWISMEKVKSTLKLGDMVVFKEKLMGQIPMNCFGKQFIVHELLANEGCVLMWSNNLNLAAYLRIEPIIRSNPFRYIDIIRA